MKIYDIRELPNIDDPQLIHYCVCAQELRRTTIAFAGDVLLQLTNHPVTTPIRVALAILQRIQEGVLSVELLCMKNRVRDAAIIILTLHELTLDLKYISQDVSRAEIWMDHAAEHKKPWPVASQIRAVCSTQNEQDAEQELYRMYSMVKHGNPVADNFSFPIAAKRDMLKLDAARANSPMVWSHIYALCGHLHAAALAAAKIWSTAGLHVTDFVDKINTKMGELNKHNEEHIKSILIQYELQQHAARNS